MSTPDWARITAAALTLERMQEDSAARARAMSARLWGQLGPSGLWTDALIVGAASRETVLMMSLVESMRRLGWVYGKNMVSLLGGVPASGLEPWLPNRLGTDPFLVSLRTPDWYRHLATLQPTVRPDSFTDPEGGTVARQWLDSALNGDWSRIDRDATQAAESSAVSQYDSAGYMTYMRVPHPEASQHGSCGLCIAASMRTYSTSHLMPLHDHCHCTVVPAGVAARKADRHGNWGLPYTGQDQFGDLSDSDAQLLKRVYEAAGGRNGSWDTSRGALANVRMDSHGVIHSRDSGSVKTVVNGEIGPVFDRVSARNSRWHNPTVSDARSQLEAVRARCGAFDSLFRRAVNGSRATATIDGRKWVFMPGNGVRAASQANSLLARAARQRILQLE